MTLPVNIGDVIADKYCVEHVLGTGGMGVVVAARHMQLDEQVAIKFLLPEASKSPVMVTRFLREGRAAVKIRSEHVARVLDVGTLNGKVPYIVMEYLEGSDLAAIVKAHGPLAIEDAIEHILQACEAIAEAHVHGIVHRDLKPSNLFLTTRADGSPSIKVIDFGIVKIGERPSGEAEITGTLEARGSPLFMSPEQMVSTRDVDARSDIWSLGVALYYLLTAQYPFQAPTMPQICGLVLTAEPNRLRDLLPSAPEGLEEAILCCLEKDPAARFQNVAELAQALAVFVAPEARISADRAWRVIHAATFQAAKGSSPSRPGVAPVPPTRGSSPSYSSLAPVPRASSLGERAGSSLPLEGTGTERASLSGAAFPGGSATPASGAVTAGPVVGPREASGSAPARRTGLVILAAGIAAAVLMAVTIITVLLILRPNPTVPSTSAAGPPAPSRAPSAGASVEVDASATAAPQSGRGDTLAEPGSPPGPASIATEEAARPPTSAAAPSALPAAAVSAKPVATSKPLTGRLPVRPKPTADLFDTPK